MAKKGVVNIITERCKGCSYCVEFCPFKVLKISEDHNSKGYRYPVVDKPNACTACNTCALFCPDFAIWADAVDEKSKKGDK